VSNRRGRAPAGNRLDVSAYRCVGVAARNRQNQLRPSSPLRPVVTQQALDNGQIGSGFQTSDSLLVTFRLLLRPVINSRYSDGELERTASSAQAASNDTARRLAHPPNVRSGR